MQEFEVAHDTVEMASDGVFGVVERAGQDYLFGYILACASLCNIREEQGLSSFICC